MIWSWILTYFDNIIIERLLLAIHLVDMEKFAQMFSPPKLQELEEGNIIWVVGMLCFNPKYPDPLKSGYFWRGPTAAI